MQFIEVLSISKSLLFVGIFCQFLRSQDVRGDPLFERWRLNAALRNLPASWFYSLGRGVNVSMFRYSAWITRTKRAASYEVVVGVLSQITDGLRKVATWSSFRRDKVGHSTLWGTMRSNQPSLSGSS